MVRITDGSVEREVTKGAFDNLYSKMGFTLVQNKTVSKKEETEEVVSKPEVTEKVEKEYAKESFKDSKRTSKK